MANEMTGDGAMGKNGADEGIWKEDGRAGVATEGVELEKQTVEMEKMGVEYQLGVPLEVYDTAFKKTIGCYAAIFGCILAPIALMGGLVTRSGIEAALVLLAVFSLIVVIAFFNQRIRVYVYDGGMIYVRGAKKQVIRWSEVAGVQELTYRMYDRGGGSSTQRVYMLVLRNGKKMQLFSQLDRVSELAQTIQAYSKTGS